MDSFLTTSFLLHQLVCSTGTSAHLIIFNLSTSALKLAKSDFVGSLDVFGQLDESTLTLMSPPKDS